ncbi:hypothetical protein B0A69_02480 [Chryseobacterium shigense]|uniref:Uncharacterized protein n=1 Tax=Chryseobacterium shigense TaxID=297244 RepID=A0A1N7I8Q6_9FLAO|nr:hypothetical protein [Chryseobacterium shigense]PQA96946.1 hypothetical protein B0A69_02480 [Chryseobacterium shigense]SIS33457.1 hypothetical protein SAMN05421639_102636 [Chryseobacterium shigense]
MLEFIIYILLIFAAANLYYFAFSDHPNRKRTILYIILPFSAFLLVTAIFLSLIDSDDLVRDTGDFFLFLLFSNILLVAFTFFLLAIHHTVTGMFSSAKNYGTYVFVFSIAAFFGCPLLAFVLYAVVSLIFGFGS